LEELAKRGLPCLYSEQGSEPSPRKKERKKKTETGGGIQRRGQIAILEKE